MHHNCVCVCVCVCVFIYLFIFLRLVAVPLLRQSQTYAASTVEFSFLEAWVHLNPVGVCDQIKHLLQRAPKSKVHTLAFISLDLMMTSCQIYVLLLQDKKLWFHSDNTILMVPFIRPPKLRLNNKGDVTCTCLQQPMLLLHLVLYAHPCLWRT